MDKLTIKDIIAARRAMLPKEKVINTPYGEIIVFEEVRRK